MNGWFDWVSSPIESAKNAYNSAIAEWHEALANLDAAIADFESVRLDAESDPVLYEQWQTANGHLSLLSGTINGANEAIDTIVGWFSSAVEAVGLSGARSGQMGALPVVAWIGIVTAAIATVWAVVDELRLVYVSVQNKKISDQNIINAQNGQAIIPYLDLNTPGGGGGLLGGLPDVVKWAAIGVLGFMALKAFEGRRV